jgi:hypothetical protein
MPLSFSRFFGSRIIDSYSFLDFILLGLRCSNPIILSTTFLTTSASLSTFIYPACRYLWIRLLCVSIFWFGATLVPADKECCQPLCMISFSIYMDKTDNFNAETLLLKLCSMPWGRNFYCFSSTPFSSLRFSASPPVSFSSELSNLSPWDVLSKTSIPVPILFLSGDWKIRSIDSRGCVKPLIELRNVVCSRVLGLTLRAVSG